MALKISWADRASNEEVYSYKKIEGRRSIWTTIRERKKKLIGHMRNNTWIRSMIEGKIKGKPERGRPRQSYMKQIILD